MSFKKRFAKCLDRLNDFPDENGSPVIELMIEKDFIEVDWHNRYKRSQIYKSPDLDSGDREAQLAFFLSHFEAWLDREEHKLAGIGDMVG